MDATILEQVRKPECGWRDGIDTARVMAVIRTESGFDPLVIGVNADKQRGLPHAVVRSTTADQAVARAAALLADHRSIDLGLGGINAANLARDGLTLRTAFDPCASIRATYHHLAADFEAAAWELAHRRYNTGRFDRGDAYAAGIQAMIRKVQFGVVSAGNAEPVSPPARHETPAMEDALHAGPPATDVQSGVTDAFFHRNPKDKEQ